MTEEQRVKYLERKEHLDKLAKMTKEERLAYRRNRKSEYNKAYKEKMRQTMKPEEFKNWIQSKWKNKRDRKTERKHEEFLRKQEKIRRNRTGQFKRRQE